MKPRSIGWARRAAHASPLRQMVAQFVAWRRFPYNPPPNHAGCTRAFIPTPLAAAGAFAGEAGAGEVPAAAESDHRGVSDAGGVLGADRGGDGAEFSGARWVGWR